MRKLAATLTKVLLLLAVMIMTVAALALAVIETDWGKDQLRGVLIQQANRHLTATLTFDRLKGSLFTNIEIDGIQISRDGAPIVSIQSVALAYRLRDLWTRGTLERLRIVRPQVRLQRQSDGRWNLATLIKGAAREGQPAGPGRQIHLVSTEIVDAEIVLRDPVEVGGVHMPTRYDSLNAVLSFAYEAPGWRATIVRASWRGSAPDLAIDRLAGEIENGPRGLTFRDFAVATERTAFTLSGTIRPESEPTRLDLSVRADRFDFQEWAGLVRGFEHIAVRARFDARLRGPLTRIDARLELEASAGSIRGDLTLDTTVPGWHGAGTLDLNRLDLAGWLNRPDRPSDITGRVTFDLALGFGRHWPRGTYAFNGSHAAFMGYSADHVRARGDVTARDVRVAEASARA